MSRFTEYLKEAMSDVADYSNNSTHGNVPVGNGSTISNVPSTDVEEKDETGIESFIQKYDISLDKETVETIIALTNKTLADFNREKDIDGKVIESTVMNAIKDGLIQIR